MFRISSASTPNLLRDAHLHRWFFPPTRITSSAPCVKRLVVPSQDPPQPGVVALAFLDCVAIRFSADCVFPSLSCQGKGTVDGLAHPATLLALRWVWGGIRNGEELLDYGTGSGVLAIAALLLGAKHAVRPPPADIPAQCPTLAGVFRPLPSCPFQLPASCGSSLPPIPLQGPFSAAPRVPFLTTTSALIACLCPEGGC